MGKRYKLFLKKKYRWLETQRIFTEIKQYT